MENKTSHFEGNVGGLKMELLFVSCIQSQWNVVTPIFFATSHVCYGRYTLSTVSLKASYVEWLYRILVSGICIFDFGKTSRD
jgi:hypothetical protein